MFSFSDIPDEMHSLEYGLLSYINNRDDLLGVAFKYQMFKYQMFK